MLAAIRTMPVTQGNRREVSAGRMIAQVNMVRAIDAAGSQKSKFRIGVDACSQKTASRLPTSRNHPRQ